MFQSVPAASEGRRALHDEAIAALAGRFGARFSTSASVRQQHCGSEAYHRPAPPEGVLFAGTTEDVRAAVQIATQFRMPIIPFGAGTSLEGHTDAVRGGLCIDLSQMNRVLAINDRDLDATVQAGVTREQLNEHLRPTGLFFPVDPGANATLGGMAATRASGTNAVRYGTMRENVVNLTVVTAAGKVIRTSGRARKSAAGLDLTRLFVGSEGTLGIITELTVRLYGRPEEVAAGSSAFPSIAEAVDAVVATIQYGVPVSRIELLDPFSIQAFNMQSGMSLAVAPTLFVELTGSKASVAEQVSIVGEIFADHGGNAIAFATTADERSRIWQARHQMHYALLAQRPGARPWGTDVCVPISALPRCIADIEPDIRAAPFPISLLGHVGDGNFHLGLLIDPNSETEMAIAANLNNKLVACALALDGTSTGEHGVGYGKAKFMRAEHGDALETMWAIKQALDPLGIFNPGKIFPSEEFG